MMKVRRQRDPQQNPNQEPWKRESVRTWWRAGTGRLPSWRVAFGIGGLGLLFAFQNCAPFSIGEGVDLSSVEADQSAKFLAYPHASPPKFYSDVRLERKTGASAASALANIRVAAAMRFISDPRASLQYEVSVQRPDGYAMCPTESGTLEAGRSAVEFDCVSAVQSDHAKVILRLSAAGQTAVVQREF